MRNDKGRKLESAGQQKKKKIYKIIFSQGMCLRRRIKCGMMEGDKGEETDGRGVNNWPGTKATN